MRSRWILASAFWVMSLAASGLAWAGEPKEGEDRQFVRLVVAEDESPAALETAIVRYVPKDSDHPGRVVDLISAVHVADATYYAELNRLFKQYDVVLYELVAPEGVEIPRGGPRAGSSSPVSMLQNAMTVAMELEFQLRGIDYTRPNLVRADMTPEQFAQSMEDRGESMLQIFFRLMGYALSREASSGGSGDLRLLMALFDKNRALAIKRVMAEQFEDIEGSLAAINGPDGSTLITERNKVALKVLRRELAAGRKKVAIFYGAGHMPDFERRLGDDFGLRPGKVRWLVAWDLNPEAESEAESESEEPSPDEPK